MYFRTILPQLWISLVIFDFPEKSSPLVVPTDDPAYDLECYSCNSLHDPHCGDPFSDYSIGSVRCSLLPPLEHLVPHDSNPLHVLRPPKPVVCRKLVQMVQNHTRIIRGCGYIEHDRDDKQCVERTGTKDIRLTYCACTRKLCNGGRRAATSGALWPAGALLIAPLFRRLP